MSASVVLKGFVNKDIKKAESKNGNQYLKFSMSIRNRSNANTPKEDKNFYPLVFYFEDPKQGEMPDLKDSDYAVATGQLSAGRPKVVIDKLALSDLISEITSGNWTEVDEVSKALLEKCIKAYNNIVVYADAIEKTERQTKE